MVATSYPHRGLYSSSAHTTQAWVCLWVRSELLQLVDHGVDVHLE